MAVPVRISYTNELTTGPHAVRPWQLAWRSDFGLSSLCEPDELYTLAELILAEGSFVDSFVDAKSVFNLVVLISTQLMCSCCHSLLPTAGSAQTPTSPVSNV